MSKPIIKVENIFKLYEIGARKQSRSLRESAERWWDTLRKKPARNLDPLLCFPEAQKGPKPNTFWALNDISFEVHPGEVIGIIGRNGAGKSTLLKILSRITEPTSGHAILRGRVASLLEVGTGFHQDLTGRENVYLNGAILGMRRREIDKEFANIVEFAEIEKFIDTPVKHYSSGMYVRLAFAVAAHLQAEILLVDEVLAVGDIAFQKKSLGKMEEASKNGRTVLFVSHNIGATRNLCEKTMWFDHGQLFLKDKSDLVIEKYLMENNSGNGLWKRLNPPSKAEISIEEISVRNGLGEIIGNIDSTKNFDIHVAFYAAEDVRGGQIHIRVVNQEGVAVFTTATIDSGLSLTCIQKGSHRYCVKIPGGFLAPGFYYLVVGAVIPQKILDIVENGIGFSVENAGLKDRSRTGIVTPNFDWKEI
jgi:lipopolysaccharide transport system ATP-binding protein